MNKQFAYVLALAALTTAWGSCKKGGDFEKTESGLLYKHVVVSEKNPNAKIGDLLTLNVIYKSESDSELLNTYKVGRPVKVQLREPSFKGSLEEGFAMMHAGDSSLFKVQADSFFAKFLNQPMPKEVKPGSYLTFYIKMEEIKDKAEVEKEQSAAMEKQKAMMEEMQNKEGETLSKFLAENKITAKPTASGLIYAEKKKGTGKQAEKGKTVKVNYTGTLLDGTMFDTSIEEDAKKGNIYDKARPYQPIEFKLGEGQVIAGWDEAIGLMKVGGKATIILPSSIAYGANGGGPIPPFAPLKFEVELLDVK